MSKLVTHLVTPFLDKSAFLGEKNYRIVYQKERRK